MKIISASRRTDIPAFYGDWFMNRIAAGFAGYINPFNNKKYTVSLKKEDTAAVVLWSKNFTPFIDSALLLKNEGYTLFFNYTITGLPGIFEPGAPAEVESLESIKQLSGMFSRDHINWRYDPAVISDITNADYHMDKFEKLCRSLSGYVRRCYISFPSYYGKVERSFKGFTEKTGITLHTLPAGERVMLAEELSSIAGCYGIKVYSCCGDYLTGGSVEKGRCIDRDILSGLSGFDLSKFKIRPTRKECGCTESTDIGIYDSCPHGCIYCYAGSSREKAVSFHDRYKSDSGYTGSAFLGASGEESGLWLKEIEADTRPPEHEEHVQTLLF